MAEATLVTGDAYKDEVQRQWDRDPCGSHYVKDAAPETLEWFAEVERYRYGTYAPWMPKVMEFADHAGEQVLEVGAGLGTDLAQFAKNGAIVTDLDMSSEHLRLARRNFELRGLRGEFRQGDAENLPFDANTFDLVYSNGVIHHTPNTQRTLREIHRVLKPGGRAIIMVYAENSLHYWRNLVFAIGLRQAQFAERSIADIMSASVELSEHGSKPLVKVYTKRRIRAMLAGFSDISIRQRQMVPQERPRWLSRVPVAALERVCGWNLIVKARKTA
ncbi:MAG: class I SAM-dependent methyltransferase [Alphaproteobacteria bacterium]|nr:class I SAM-dependent methyltransferase [Alphaproteobacteria bacterium]